MAYVVSAKGTYPPRFDWKPSWPVYRDAPVPEAIFFRQSYGLRIAPHEVPKRAVLKSSHKILSDLISPMDNTVLVSSVVKDIWDRLAPGQVEFIPIELVRGRGSPVSDKPITFSTSPIRSRHSSIPNRLWSSKKGRTGFGYRYVKLPFGWFAETGLKLTVQSTARNGLSIWREWDSGDIASWIFVSDDVARAMKDAGCTGIEYMAVTEL
jgi:hypothetical protein